MSRFLAPALFLLGLLCLGVSAWGYFTREPGPALVIDATDRTLAAQPGQQLKVAYLLRNTGAVPIRIVGLAPC